MTSNRTPSELGKLCAVVCVASTRQCLHKTCVAIQREPVTSHGIFQVELLIHPPEISIDECKDNRSVMRSNVADFINILQGADLCLWFRWFCTSCGIRDLDLLSRMTVTPAKASMTAN